MLLLLLVVTVYDVRYVHRVCPLTEEKEELGFPTTIASTRILAFFTCLVNLSCSCTSHVFPLSSANWARFGGTRQREWASTFCHTRYFSFLALLLLIDDVYILKVFWKDAPLWHFFTDYSLKIILFNHGQINCKYLSHSLSGLMSLQNNILSRFLSIRSFVHLTMSESIGKSKKSNDGFITDLADYWTTKMSTERAVAGDDHLLLSLIKYWNFEYTIYYILFVLYIVQYPF